MTWGIQGALGCWNLGYRVSDIMEWSASTAVRMAKRYGHIGHSGLESA